MTFEQKSLQSFAETSPFYGMKIADLSVLASCMINTQLATVEPDADQVVSDSSMLVKVHNNKPVTISPRISCPKCHKSSKFYCAHCPRFVTKSGRAPRGVPQCRLPVHIDVWKHVGERDGKSTALHAVLLAPEDTSLWLYPLEKPKYEDLSRTLVLFPSEQARELSEYDPRTFDRILVLDGTWTQAKQMLREPEVQGMRHVRIKPPSPTSFWRFQQVGPDCLATIEAIRYVCIEYHEAHGGISGERAYSGQYDNVLFYYAFLFQLVQDTYKKSGKQFTSRHRPNYIQSDS